MRVAIAGAAGRMGRTLIEAVLRSGDLALGAALEAPGHPQLGKDAGESLGMPCGVTLTADVAAAAAAADCLVDFTAPQATLAHVAACVAARRSAVIGTTGFAADDKARIAAAARAIPIAMAPNFAIGVNVTFKLAEVAARILGDAYDVEIVEAHHRHKVDAPSGTALRLGEAVAGALGRELKAVAVYGREGITGERGAKEIAFHAIRGGDIVGEHTVIFAGEGERVEVTVRSGNRMTYAQGALRAARWLAGRPAGLYDMFDVLGLK
ncbi:MAG TPA: 4-hydroxy-tetrahydrodipicolinate reductase [Burkholderiales bacterium]|nr:4-hydroxy-tetrahydrodipicolinate reductase [Burkholderiales bacterium]